MVIIENYWANKSKSHDRPETSNINADRST